MIPNNLHFVWIGSQLPDEFKRNIDSWSRYNPDLNIMLWVDDNIHQLNISDRAMEAINLGESIYAYKSDIIRYHAVNKFGGFYSDTDVECYRKLDSTFFNYDIVCLKPHERSNWLTNAFFGSSPNCTFLNKVVSSIVPTNRQDVDKRRSYIYGPQYFTAVLVKLSKNGKGPVLEINYPNTKILNNDFWCNNNKDRYCKHYFKASWRKNR